MSDFETRLGAALAHGADGAPPAFGLAAGARTRARRRRRTRLGAAGVVAAVAVAVPAAVLAQPGPDPTEPGPAAVDPLPRDDAAPNGYHWESWHTVSVLVPNTWEHGSLSDWCAGGGGLTPRIQRPGGLSSTILCEPSQTYGISFQEIDNQDDFEWPVVHQDSEGWPPENVSGGRGIGGVLVTVTTREETVATAVLDSMRPIDAGGDPNGCQARLLPGESDPPEGALSVCRYDDTGALEQSEPLTGEDAGAAVRALQAAPAAGACADSSAGSRPHGVVTLEAAGVTARVDLVPECPRVTVDGDVRDLTSDVLLWALSPGWTGDATGLPLPGELRRQ